ARGANILSGRFALKDIKTQGAGRRHFDGGNADFAIALREVAISGREQSAVGEHRKIQLRTGGELFHIEVSAALTRRNGAQTVGCRWSGGRNGAACIRRKNKAALCQRVVFTFGPFGQLLQRRSDAGHTHERRARDTHSRYLLGCRETFLEFPADEEWRGVEVSQESQTRKNHCERPR